MGASIDAVLQEILQILQDDDGRSFEEKKEAAVERLKKGCGPTIGRTLVEKVIMEMKDYSFGNHICALRTRLGLSQFQLGALVGVSDKAVSKWENGDAKPRVGTCFRLAEILEIGINELLSCEQTIALPARKEQRNMSN